MNVTPETVFNMSRREVLRILGIAGVASLLPAGLCAAESVAGLAVTSEDAATTYNNFYEFGFTKRDPALNSKNFDTSGWKIQVDGAVKNPLTISLEELTKRFGTEERIYRMRCVEGWSMVIPWGGLELNKLITLAQPDGTAKYVGFESYADPRQMPSVGKGSFPFPYLEALRLDEAMHPLTILATGAYGKDLQPQNGAPVRLVVPWKYGFKSTKSIVKITLTAEQPRTTWDSYNPREYGFYANVNPNVPHPRWQQDTEKLIGPGGLSDTTRQPTLLFNGYSEVASLYEDMDLTKQY